MNLSIDASLLLYPNWSGVQVYAFHILDEMTNIGLDHTFHLHFDQAGTNPRLEKLLSKPNVRSHSRVGNLRYHSMLPIDLWRLKSDVYYSLSGRLKTKLPCPAAVIVYDNGEHILPDHYGNNAPELRRKQQGAFLRRMSLVFTISQAVKQEIVELFGVSEQRLIVAPPAVEPLVAGQVERKPAAIPPDCSFFLMVNPGRSYKNWADAFTAFTLYAAAHPEDQRSHLVLAGDLREEAGPISRALAGNPMLKNRVLCLGYVSASELSYLYRHAHLLLLPSLYEGFGIPALEAMAHQLPVITSDIAVLQEVTGNAAIHVPIGKPEQLATAMASLISDQKLRRCLTNKGASRLKYYVWQESADIVLTALTKIVSA